MQGKDRKMASGKTYISEVTLPLKDAQRVSLKNPLQTSATEEHKKRNISHKSSERTTSMKFSFTKLEQTF